MKMYEKNNDMKSLHTIIKDRFVPLDKLEVKFNFIVYPLELFYFYEKLPIYNIDLDERVDFYIIHYDEMKKFILQYTGETITIHNNNQYIIPVVNDIFNIKVDFIGNLDKTSIIQIISNIEY